MHCDDYITTPYATLDFESVGVWAAEDLVGHLECLRDAGELANDGVAHDFDGVGYGTCEKHENECHGDGSYIDT